MVDSNINEKFEWLVGMDYDKAKGLMLGHRPYHLYAYYLNGNNTFMTANLDFYRIHVRVENNTIVLVNGNG